MFSNQTNSIITKAFLRKTRPEVVLEQLKQAGITIPLVSVNAVYNLLRRNRAL